MNPDLGFGNIAPDITAILDSAYANKLIVESGCKPPAVLPKPTEPDRSYLILALMALATAIVAILCAIVARLGTTYGW